jgi:hypothetical protein
LILLIKNHLISFYTRYNVSTLLFLTLFLSLLIQTINVGFNNCISTDGIFHVGFARSLFEGNYEEYLSEFHSCFYAVLIAITSLIIDDLELAGQMVCAIAASSMVILMYFIGKRFFNSRIGLFMALMAALCPLFNASSCKVKTDMPYAFFYAWAFLAGYDLVQKPTAKRALIFSLLSAAAYYLRPEGIGIVFVIGCWLLYSCSRVTFPYAIKKCFWFSFFVLLFLLLIYPRLAVIRSQSGEWTFSAKTSYIIRNIPELQQSIVRKNMRAERKAYKQSGGIGKIIVKFPWLLAKKMTGNMTSYIRGMPKALGVGFFMLMFMGIFYRKAIPFRREQELFFLFVILFNVMAVSLFKYKSRLFISVLPFLYIWCAIGMVEMQSALKNRKGLLSCIVLIVFLSILPQTFRPVSKYGYSWRHSPEKTAGRWIRENIPQSRFLSWHGKKTLFYAGLSKLHKINEGASYDHLLEIAQENDLQYLIVGNDSRRKSIRKKGADFFEQVKHRTDMQFVYSVRQPPIRGEIVIYKLFTHDDSK